NALGIPHSDMALSIIEILIGLVGVYVLMTYYRQLRYSEDRSKQELAEDRKSIFTNPVLLIYLAILIYEMVNDLIEANIRV
ncbi:MAG: hypothetical protein IJ555_06310, partial [Ruminococcus sp.]|nr:hypothetical protein [Ruminococcus sp.]